MRPKSLLALDEALKKGLVNAKVVPAKTYDEAIALLEGGKTDALAAGKTMLLGIGAFDPNAKPSGALLVMYGLNVYPER